MASGDASVETRNFASNPYLEHGCDKKYPPVLFHKKEVTHGSRGVVADDLGAGVTANIALRLLLASVPWFGS